MVLLCLVFSFQSEAGENCPFPKDGQPYKNKDLCKARGFGIQRQLISTICRSVGLGKFKAEIYKHSEQLLFCKDASQNLFRLAPLLSGNKKLFFKITEYAENPVTGRIGMQVRRRYKNKIIKGCQAGFAARIRMRKLNCSDDNDELWMGIESIKNRISR